MMLKQWFASAVVAFAVVALIRPRTGEQAMVLFVALTLFVRYRLWEVLLREEKRQEKRPEDVAEAQQRRNRMVRLIWGIIGWAVVGIFLVIPLVEMVQKEGPESLLQVILGFAIIAALVKWGGTRIWG